MLNRKRINAEEKPVLTVEKIVTGNKGNRPDEVHVRDRLYVGKFAIWSSKHYPGHSAPGLYQTESNKYNTKSGEEQKEKRRYQNLVVKPKDSDWNQATSFIEQQSAGATVAYLIYTGQYAKALKDFLAYLEGAKNEWNCSTCAYRKRVEFVVDTPSGMTDDDNNATYFCSLCDKEITKNYREAKEDRSDTPGNTNYRKVLRDCFHQGFRNCFSAESGKHLPCPWHDKFYKRNNGLGWFRENPKPFFPIRSFDDGKGNRFYGIEFDQFILDITYAFKEQKKKRVNGLLDKLKKYRVGLDIDEAESMFDCLTRNKVFVPEVRDKLRKRFLKLKGGE